mmetsp:Transcript_12424/g.22230  ORF Transcript_12424/g.22230 Transcript_12424/m.22230 type:complete len:210 (-) Transcript_12424:850-1479(-)
MVPSPANGVLRNMDPQALPPQRVDLTGRKPAFASAGKGPSDLRRERGRRGFRRASKACWPKNDAPFRCGLWPKPPEMACQGCRLLILIDGPHCGRERGASPKEPRRRCTRSTKYRWQGSTWRRRTRRARGLGTIWWPRNRSRKWWRANRPLRDAPGQNRRSSACNPSWPKCSWASSRGGTPWRSEYISSREASGKGKTGDVRELSRRWP